MITYKKGNLLDAPENVIIHGVNSKGIMGSGVALAIKNKWPHVFNEYKKWFVKCSTDRPYHLPLGDVQVIAIEPSKWIVNAVTQESYGKDGKRYVSYDAIDAALCRLYTRFDPATFETPVTIAMPKIGAGLGGGNWDIIETIIEYRLNGLSVTVYEL